MTLRRSNLLHKFIRALGYICFHLIYRLKIEGRENLPLAGPGILLPKHQFWTDIPIVGLAARKPASYIAKHELFVYPGLRHVISAMGGVPVDRLNPVKSRHSFRYVEQLLQKGELIVLFPEGTYYPHTMGRGKYRFIQRLLRFQDRMGWQGEKAIPFIPVGIRYEEKRFRSGVYVKIGLPLYARSELDGEEFTQRIVGEIAKLSGLDKGRPE